MYMRYVKIENHEDLQKTVDYFLARLHHKEPDVLRGAILEVIQNTLQHSDGKFYFFITPYKTLVVANRLVESNIPTNGLGLKLYSGIETRNYGEIFVSEIKPDKVKLQKLNIEEILRSCTTS